MEDIKISQDVYSPIITSLKGKTTHNKSLKVKQGILKVPSTTNNMHRNVLLYFDIFFVIEIPFLLS